MKLFLSLLLIFVIAVVNQGVVSSQDLPVYIVKKTNSSITIDGKLDEKSWQDADTTSHFVILGTTNTKPATITWAKLLWDDTYLYVGMYCQDKNIWATLTTRDAPLYTEDVVEVYLDPDGDGLNYIELEVNPLNTIMDLWMDKPWSDGGVGTFSWNFSNIHTAVQVNGTIADSTDVDSCWTCEMALPFSEMQFLAPSMHYPPINNDLWRANLYRFDRGTPAVTAHEETGWSQTGGGQHVPDEFGILQFKNIVTQLPSSTENQAMTDNVIICQNYPNPFWSSTTINYYIPRPCTSILRIFDISGRQVLSKSVNHVSKGNYSISVNTNTLAPGIYNYTLQVENYHSSKMKMIVLK